MRTSSWICGVIYVSVAIAAVGCDKSGSSRSGYSRVDELPFDRDKWVNYDKDNSSWTLRSRMIDDLLRKHQFTGMTRGEVIRLLGEPSEVDNPDFREWNMLYRVGLERREFPMDYEFLAFKLDKGERVVQYRTVCE